MSTLAELPGWGTHEKCCAEAYEEEADDERVEWWGGGLDRVADGDDE